MPAGLHSNACVYDVPRFWRGLRDSYDRERLSREYHGHVLPVVERGLQRALRPTDGHGQLSEHSDVQLVDLQWDAETLQRLFRRFVPRLCPRRLLRHSRTERKALRISHEAGRAGDRRGRDRLQLQDMHRSRVVLWRSGVTVPEHPGLRADAWVHDESCPRRGLRGGHHAECLSGGCSGRKLHLGERYVQRFLQRCDRHGDLPEHPGVQLVCMHGNAEILRRVFRGFLPHLSHRLLRHDQQLEE